MVGVMRKIGAWIDRELCETGLTRKDLRYKFKWRGKKYYVPTFNPLWWIITVSLLVIMFLGLYLSSVLMILIGG